jgi:hypothetical protein
VSAGAEMRDLLCLWEISKSLANLVFSYRTPVSTRHDFHICRICFDLESAVLEDRYSASVAEWVKARVCKILFVGSNPTAGFKSKFSGRTATQTAN